MKYSEALLYTVCVIIIFLIMPTCNGRDGTQPMSCGPSIVVSIVRHVEDK